MLNKLLRARSLQQAACMVSQTQRAMGAFVNHRDTSDNLEETPFEFTEDNYQKIYEKLSHYPDNYKHSAVIPVLFIAQK